MAELGSQKIGYFKRNWIKITEIPAKINKKYKENEDFKSGIGLVLDVLFLGLMSEITYAGLQTSNLWINLVALGCGFWLIKEKVVPMIVQILNAFRLVSK